MIIDVRDGKRQVRSVQPPTGPGRDRRVLYFGTDHVFVRSLEEALRNEGIDVAHVAPTTPSAMALRDHDPALVLIEMRAPATAAIDLCRSIRLHSDLPLLVIASQATETDLVLAFELGADDFLLQPIRVREMVARIRRSLQRHLHVVRHNPAEDTIHVGELTIDVNQRAVSAGGHPLHLPRKEFDLLVLLALHAGKAMPRSTILSSIWGGDYVGSTNTLDVHVKRLRKKVEALSAGHTIVTVRGFGYMLKAQRAKHPASVPSSDAISV
ncbi:MAG: response regulator transcription factor [Acidimicrobiales bacterium]